MLQKEFLEEIIALFIFESNMIEGERYLTYDALLKQLRGDHSFGHVGAWKLFAAAADKGRLPTTGEIFEAHRLLIAEQLLHHQDAQMTEDLADQTGCWRTVPVGVEGGEECPPPEVVPEEMFRLLSFCDTAFAGHSDSLLVRNGIGNVHYRFLKIHPFADGNGRISRLYANAIGRMCGVPPIIFTAGDRYERYYPACAADTPEKMRAYVTHALDTLYG